MLLYERLLGRPFAGHRDSVSELIGNIVESAIEDVLSKEGVSYRKTKRAERLAGFDQTPDFVAPNEKNPKVVIEAKLTEDDGTARDKVTRVQHLRTLSMEGQPTGQLKFEVVACIAGRGFGVRREDMKKLLLSTQGKVFTLQNMSHLVEHTPTRDPALAIATASRGNPSGLRFNEAGADPPRKCTATTISGAGVIRFNEAGAGPPRKSGYSCRSPHAALPCFNEAGAGPPRKCRPLMTWRFCMTMLQ